MNGNSPRAVVIAAPDSKAAEASTADAVFRESAYHFMTFLYAAAVHLLIHQARETHRPELSFYTFVLILILFLFSDWASRSRLPRLIPERPAGHLLFAKVTLEVICVFFLLIAFLLHISHHEDKSSEEGIRITAYMAFAFFLLATSLWDYLMIYIMRELDRAPLVRAVWNGQAIKMKAAEEYLTAFRRWRAEREEDIKREVETSERGLGQDPDHPFRTWSRGAARIAAPTYRLAVFQAAVTSFVQFLANHVLYANALAGIALLLNIFLFDHPPLEGIWVIPSFDEATRFLAWFPSVSITLLVVVIASVSRSPVGLRRILCLALLGTGCFLVLKEAVPRSEWLALGGLVAAVALVAILCYLPWVQDQCRGGFCGGLVILLSLVIFYFWLPALLLCAMLAIQQVLANTFLQVSVATQVGNPEIAASVNPKSDLP